MIDAFLEYLSLEKKYSLHTVTAYKNDLRSFKDFLVSEYDQENFLEVHYPQIRSWIVVLVGENLSNRTINRKISSLKSLYKFLTENKSNRSQSSVTTQILKNRKKSSSSIYIQRDQCCNMSDRSR